MGHGIALVAAKSGYDVVIKDIKEETARKGIKRIEKFLTVSVEKGRMTEEIKKETLSRIKSVSELKDIKNCDLVIEAIAEDLESKKRLFKELDDICSANTIFASNTSTISITKFIVRMFSYLIWSNNIYLVFYSPGTKQRLPVVLPCKQCKQHQKV